MRGLARDLAAADLNKSGDVTRRHSPRFEAQ
jgi:hypothetical protein